MRTLLLIPKRVGPVADVASADETRLFLNGVHVKRNEDGSAIIETTDGRSLLRVTLAKDESRDGKDFPVVSGLDPAKNDQTEAIIPTEVWNSAFAAAKKLGRKQGGGYALPILQHVALTMHEGQATLAVTDLASTTVLPVKAIEGKFPNTDVVLPHAEDTPRAIIWFDAERVASMLKTISGMVSQGGHAVRLEVYGPLSAVAFRAHNEVENLEVVGMIAPLRMYESSVPDHWPKEAKSPK